MCVHSWARGAWSWVLSVREPHVALENGSGFKAERPWVFAPDLVLVSCDFCPCRGGWWQQGQGMVWMESGEESSKSWEKGGKKEQVCLPSEEGRI